MKDTVTFDTHRFVKNLTACGFTERQAEVLAEEQVNLLESNLANKADIAAVRADVEASRLSGKADIEALRLATKADIATVKAELLKWMIGAMIAQGGLIVALVELL